jgi:simple sugar transport system permease protein
VKVREKALERALVVLSRYWEASIAVIAVVLVAYFQFACRGPFLSSQELSVILRDTGRFGLIAVAEVMLMITGEIDLSVGSTFSLAPYVMVICSLVGACPGHQYNSGGRACVLIGVVNGSLLFDSVCLPSLPLSAYCSF